MKRLLGMMERQNLCPSSACACAFASEVYCESGALLHVKVVMRCD